MTPSVKKCPFFKGIDQHLLVCFFQLLLSIAMARHFCQAALDTK